jgi:hypothetical protein
MKDKHGDWGKFAEDIPAYTLIVAFLVGLAIFAHDLFDQSSEANTISRLIAAIVGLLALSLGLERFVRFRRYDTQLDQLRGLMNRNLGGVYLRGVDEIYTSGARICGGVNNRIRVVVHSTTPPAPEYWVKAVAGRLRQTDEWNDPARFELIIAGELKNLPADFAEGLANRLIEYRKHGVRNLTEQISVFLLDASTPIGFDLMVVDGEQAIVGFRSNPNKKMLQRAILFEGKNEITADLWDMIADLMDQHAKRYTDWIDKLPQETATTS